MAVMSHEVTIVSPPARVWEVFTDFERWPSWTPTMRRIASLGDGAAGVGSRYRIEQPKLAPAVWTLTEWSAGRAFTWVSSSPGVRVTGEHLIEPVPEGSRVVVTLHFGGWLGGLAGLLAGGLARRYMEIEGARLKQRCEEGRVAG
jgi:uncharacterized membrane protein